MTGVRDFFKGRSVLISGGTGFMGKVLIEKMLRCLPDLKAIYIIMKAKRGKSPEQRMEDMFKLPLFDKLREECPSTMSKLILVPGDLTKEGMAISEDLVNEMAKTVSIVINLAASLKLEAGLADALEANTRGSLRMLELSKKFPHILVFMHVSTAFCHCEPEVVEEKFIPSKKDPHSIMELVNWLDEDILTHVTPKLLLEHPNCYTFTKQLTEQLISQYSNSLPVLIVRPSIVIPTFKEPIPGWVDSLNGPVGLLVAAAKGVLRSMLVRSEEQAQIVPVDLAINAMILAIWKKGTSQLKEKIPVFNLTVGSLVGVTMGEILEKGRALNFEIPIEPGLWYPDGSLTTNKYVHETKFFLFQRIPALLIDLILFICGQKTFMMYIQNRIKLGLKLLQYFTMRSWKMDNDKAKSLHDGVSSEEEEIFWLANVTWDVDEYLKNAVIGCKKYCLKEPMSNVPNARKKLWIYWALDLALKSVLGYFFLMYCYRALLYLRDFRAELHTKV